MIYRVLRVKWDSEDKLTQLLNLEVALYPVIVNITPMPDEIFIVLGKSKTATPGV
jgi:hypothetical protein